MKADRNEPVTVDEYIERRKMREVLANFLRSMRRVDLYPDISPVTMVMAAHNIIDEYLYGPYFDEE